MTMERACAKQMAIGYGMYDAAKATARAVLAHLPEQGVRIWIFKRFYCSELDEKAITLVIYRNHP